jgi:hypothetical protein
MRRGGGGGAIASYYRARRGGRMSRMIFVESECLGIISYFLI